MTEQAIIELEEITKIYGSGDAQITALDGISLTIPPGEFVAIMGPSGSGKSTLMNILGCLDRPTSGRYLLAGEDVSDLSKAQLAHIRNRRLGFIFQSYNLLARTSAVDNVVLPLIYNRNGASMPDDQMQAKALEALAAVGLADRATHQPHELSGGQAQRVAIARALINDPAMILADEPTGNLDSRSGSEIMDILNSLNTQGRTIVMVTHDPVVARRASRVIRFLDGRVASDQRNGNDHTNALPAKVSISTSEEGEPRNMHVTLSNESNMDSSVAAPRSRSTGAMSAKSVRGSQLPRNDKTENEVQNAL